MINFTFGFLAALNFSRMRRWHGTSEWTIADWAVALAGEAGEMCNAVKKLRRVEGGFANKNDDPERQLDTREKAVAAIGEELADVVIYADLVAQHLGLSLADLVAAKFDKTSAMYGFPEKIRVPASKPEETKEGRRQRLGHLLWRVVTEDRLDTAPSPMGAFWCDTAEALYEQGRVDAHQSLSHEMQVTVENEHMAELREHELREALTEIEKSVVRVDTHVNRVDDEPRCSVCHAIVKGSTDHSDGCPFRVLANYKR